MLHNQPRAWVYLGGAALTVISGWTNAVGLLSVAHQGMTHVTGTVTVAGIELAKGESLLTLQAMAVVFFFFIGAVLSGLVLRDPQLRTSPRYGWALLLEGGLLSAAMVKLGEGQLSGQYLAAVACGLQNSLATSYQGVPLRTTHMTGIVSDLGRAMGHALHRQDIDWFRVRLYLVLLAGFFVGGALGATTYGRFGSTTLAFPSAMSTLLGLGYLAWTHRR